MRVRNRLKILIREREQETGERLSYRRLDRDLGISKDAIGRWVRNEVHDYNHEILWKFCHYFDVGIDQLLEVQPTDADGVSLEAAAS